MAINPMLATLLSASANGGPGQTNPVNPGNLVGQLMSVLSGGDVDGVLKGIGFAGLMKELPRVMNAAMDWKSSEQQPGEMETPEEEGPGMSSPMPGMGSGGPGPMPMPPGMPGAGPGGPGGPGGPNPIQALMALAAARSQGGPPPGVGPSPGVPSPLAALLASRRA